MKSGPEQEWAGIVVSSDELVCRLLLKTIQIRNGNSIENWRLELFVLMLITPFLRTFIYGVELERLPEMT